MRKDGFVKQSLLDINFIYNRLNTLISKRINYQNARNSYFDQVKRGATRVYEIKKVSENIGKMTYEIDKLIGELTKHKKYHKAMNLAYTYLTRELKRTNNIVIGQKNHQHKVRQGYGHHYIFSDGRVSYDPNTMNNYIYKKEQRINKLNNWLQYISNYLV